MRLVFLFLFVVLLGTGCEIGNSSQSFKNNRHLSIDELASGASLFDGYLSNKDFCESRHSGLGVKICERNLIKNGVNIE